jgi:hypothetical protein
MRPNLGTALIALVLTWLPVPAQAQAPGDPAAGLADPISVALVLAWREIRSANSLGATPGDFIKVGALDVRPNPFNGMGGLATVAQTTSPGGTVLPMFFAFSPASPNEYFRANIPFSTGRTAPWKLTFSNPNSPNSPVEVWTPAIRRADGSVPGTLSFVQDMSLSGTGTDVTFHFTPPADSRHDTIGVRIWDRDRITPSGFAPLVYAATVGPADRSHKPPVVLNADGDTLLMGRRYTVAILLEENRAFFGPAIARTLSRSISYFDFSPLAPGSPPNVFLPIVDGDNVYHFSVSVQEGRVVFIDPDAAIGYEYAIGSGDPNFASVVLPPAGDDKFHLHTFDGAEWTYRGVLDSGVTFDFGAGGVSRFRVSGIEHSAGLDPADPTAFVTGLTFVADGRFTGTMTPLLSIPDETPPVVTASIVGTAGNDGWYRGPVRVSWSVQDPESGISSAPCADTVITDDSAGQAVSCSATSTGGTTTETITIKIDKTPPAIAGLPEGCILWPPNHAMVQVAIVEGSDATSGLASFSVSATSSEADAEGDISVGSLGFAQRSVQLRAERLGGGAGRMYTITASAGDAAGNTRTATAICGVPHDHAP